MIHQFPQNAKRYSRSAKILRVAALSFSLIATQLRQTADAQSGDRDKTRTQEVLVQKLRDQFRTVGNGTGCLRRAGYELHFEARYSSAKLIIHLLELRRTLVIELETPSDIKDKIEEKTKPLTSEESASQLGSTGITADDLSFRFLFWRDISDAPPAFLHGKLCNGLHFKPITEEARISAVELWFLDNNLPLRAVVYGQDGQIAKQLDVISVRRVDGRGYIKTIRLRSPDSKEPSYIDFDIPETSKGK